MIHSLQHYTMLSHLRIMQVWGLYEKADCKVGAPGGRKQSVRVKTLTEPQPDDVDLSSTLLPTYYFLSAWAVSAYSLPPSPTGNVAVLSGRMCGFYLCVPVYLWGEECEWVCILDEVYVCLRTQTYVYLCVHVCLRTRTYLSSCIHVRVCPLADTDIRILVCMCKCAYALQLRRHTQRHIGVRTRERCVEVG